MEAFDYDINSKITARVYYSRVGKIIYLVDNSTGKEICKVELVKELDLSSFICIISNGGEDDGGRQD